ncbi:unnamed protein product, partial [Protopolystoma xenopodis]
NVIQKQGKRVQSANSRPVGRPPGKSKASSLRQTACDKVKASIETITTPISSNDTPPTICHSALLTSGVSARKQPSRLGRPPLKSLKQKQLLLLDEQEHKPLNKRLSRATTRVSLGGVRGAHISSMGTSFTEAESDFASVYRLDEKPSSDHNFTDIPGSRLVLTTSAAFKTDEELKVEEGEKEEKDRSIPKQEVERKEEGRMESELEGGREIGKQCSMRESALDEPGEPSQPSTDSEEDIWTTSEDEPGEDIDDNDNSGYSTFCTNSFKSGDNLLIQVRKAAEMAACRLKRSYKNLQSTATRIGPKIVYLKV